MYHSLSKRVDLAFVVCDRMYIFIRINAHPRLNLKFRLMIAFNPKRR